MKKLWEDAGLLPLWRLNEPLSGSTGKSNAENNLSEQSDPQIAGSNSEEDASMIQSATELIHAQLPEGLAQTQSNSVDSYDVPSSHHSNQAHSGNLDSEWITQPEIKNALFTENTQTVSSAVEAQWERLEAEVRDCRKCDLCLKRTKTVFGVGDRQPEWLFVGEGPGAEEDIKGEPFVGQAGRLLDIILDALQMSRQKGVYIANAVKCRPPENRKPLPIEMDTCFPYLEQQVDWLKPKIIIALGATGAQALLKCDTPIGKLRGKQHMYRGIPVVATYHPAYLLRSPQEKAKVWQDLVFARRLYKKMIEKTG